MIDPTTERGRRVAQRLDAELIAWLTTVRSDGQPQSSPVWFLREGDEILVYSLAGTPRTRNIARNPRVSIHLDSDGRGGRIVTIEAVARIVPDAPPASEVPAYMAKYQALLDDSGWTAEYFSAEYPVAIRIQPTRVRLG